MTETHVGKIIAAIEGLLNAPEKPNGLIVIASRSMPSNAKRLITVFPMQDKPADENRPPRTRAAIRRFLVVGIVCRIAGTDIENEELRAWALSQLISNPTLDGNAVGIIETTTDWQGELDSQNTYSMAVIQFLVEYVRPIESL